MANPARGIALGAASKAFREADRTAVQREAIQSGERIATEGNLSREGIAARSQAGQTERSSANIEAEFTKAAKARGHALVLSSIDKIGELFSTLPANPGPGEQARFAKALDVLTKTGNMGLDSIRRTDDPVLLARMQGALNAAANQEPRSADVAGAAGQAAGTAKVSEAKTVLGGAAPTATQRKKLAGVEGPNPNFKNVLALDGTESIVDFNDRSAVDALPEGATIIGKAVQATDIGGLTTGAATLQQKAEINLTNVTTELAGAQQLITGAKNAFGFMGVFNEDFLNKTVAQFAPPLFNRDVGVVRTFFRTMRETALRVASADDRFNKDDIERIGNLFPKDGVFESKPNALLKTQTLRLMFLNRLSLVRGKLGAQTGAERLSGVQMARAATLSFDDLRDATNQGKFTKAQFLQIMEIFHNDVLGAARQRRGVQ